MLPERWRATTIGDQVTLQRGIDITRAEQRNGLVPVVSSGGVSSFHDSHAVEGPGVVLGRKGVVGSVYFITSNYWPHDTTLWVKDFKNNDPQFVYYFFKSIAGRLTNLDVGSANPTLNRNHVHPIEVSWPPLDQQHNIAAVLGSLDNKIEQNRRTGRKLEELARAVFKAWFVDFEPVKAKAAGARGFPGMPSEAFADLPDRFEESELGRVPEGWSTSPIGDLVEGVYDGPHATPPESTDGPVFLGIKNLTGTRIDLSDIRRISESDWPRWTKRVEPRADDIVFTYEATIGFFAIIPPNLRCCLGRRMALMRPKTGVSPRYLFHYATSLRFQQLLTERTVYGSTVNRTSLLEFPKYPILMPTSKLQAAFESVVGPIWSSLHASDIESAKLATLRDYLLPKLLSGQVRVKDAEREVGGVS